MNKGMFVIGTGTDVGKTFVTGLLVKKLVECGFSIAYYKAAMSGNISDSFGNLIPGDAKYVRDVARLTQPLDTMCPYVYKTAVSPHLAARLEGNEVRVDTVFDNYQKLRGQYDYVVCEGSGGIICPIRYDGERIMLEDIVKMLNLPVVVVADAGLGTINSVVLTCEYLKERGFFVEGIILNRFHKGDVMEEDNKVMCESLTKIPVVACVSDGETDMDISKDTLLKMCNGGDFR